MLELYQGTVLLLLPFGGGFGLMILHICFMG